MLSTTNTKQQEGGLRKRRGEQINDAHGHHGLQFQRRRQLLERRERLWPVMLPTLLNNYKHWASGRVGREGPCVAKILSVISNDSCVDKLLFCRIYESYLLMI